MSALLSPLVRLPSRISSLVGISSILVQIQPIISLTSGHQPISTLHTCTSSYTHKGKNSHPGIWSKSRGGDQSENCPIRSGETLNDPISNRYMCGNSYSSMASSSGPVISPSGKHTATVIFLHGLGDQGYGWAAGFEEIKEPHIKYIFPNAPNMPVTLNFGMVMPSWFNIYSLGLDGKEDEPGIKQASQNLLKMVEDEESNGIAPERIVIGGFSQGGAVSLYTSLKDNRPYAGVLALSTWVPLHKEFKIDGGDKRPLPILQCHGTADAVLNYNIGKMTHELVRTQVSNAEFRTYQGLGHSSNLEEMNHVKEFLKKVLP